MLRIEALSKYFGGVGANLDIDLTLEAQQIHALIGPNGAGKSTLIAQIAGEIKPDYGCIRFHTEDITHAAPEQRNRLGIGRMFQTTALFDQLSVIDNLRIPLLRAGSGRKPGWRWIWPALANDQAVNRMAHDFLAQVGMERDPHRLAGNLSHGEQRQLEMAMTLATSPTCLLLDEPMAGMSSEESIRMLRLIGKLRQDHGILLVEHDMDAVFELADVISVLVEGRVIARGSPAEIRANSAVQQAYLGDQ